MHRTLSFIIAKVVWTTPLQRMCKEGERTAEGELMRFLYIYDQRKTPTQEKHTHWSINQ